jgi:hypothetical protein
MLEHLTYGRQLPDDLMDVMHSLNTLFGGALVVNALNSQGATFYVRGLTNEVVIRTLMTNKADVFGAETQPGGACVLGPADFQILCPLATFAPGITLRYLPNLPDEYLSGFWYY